MLPFLSGILAEAINKKIRFQQTLNKTFCPTPPPLSQQQLKH